MVTPSLVIVGAPHFLSRTTLRPLGPRVIETASASLSTPASRDRRASSLNFSCFAAMWVPPDIDVGRGWAPPHQRSCRGRAPDYFLATASTSRADRIR